MSIGEAICSSLLDERNQVRLFSAALQTLCFASQNNMVKITDFAVESVSTSPRFRDSNMRNLAWAVDGRIRDEMQVQRR